jgi:tRNA pseudouridine38-40 synthase
VQPGRRTVQGELQAVLATVLLLPSVRLTVAGRTDAGVHARGQVAHLDLPGDALAAAAGRGERDRLDALRHRLSGVLGDDVTVRRVSVAPDGFDARFSALQRRYAYRISDDAAALDPLRRREVLVVRGPVDLTVMNAASANLLGLNDFAAFCRQREGATTTRTLIDLSWSRDQAATGLIEARVVADAFCHSMVRALVGAVLEVGRGRRPVGWPEELLRGGVRHPAAPVVRPHGLCLEEVTYPADELLAARVVEARARRG